MASSASQTERTGVSEGNAASIAASPASSSEINRSSSPAVPAANGSTDRYGSERTSPPTVEMRRSMSRAASAVGSVSFASDSASSGERATESGIWLFSRRSTSNSNSCAAREPSLVDSELSPGTVNCDRPAMCVVIATERGDGLACCQPTSMSVMS